MVTLPSLWINAKQKKNTFKLINLNLKIGILHRIVIKEVIQIALVWTEARIRGALKPSPFRAAECLIEIRQRLTARLLRCSVVFVFYVVGYCRLKHLHRHFIFQMTFKKKPSQFCVSLPSSLECLHCNHWKPEGIVPDSLQH